MRCVSRVMPILLRRKAMIGAKSSADQGSGSVGGGDEGLGSGSATSDSPAVLRPRKGRKDAVQVKHQQETFLVADDPPHEWRRLL
jgi:hypothetical protein